MTQCWKCNAVHYLILDGIQWPAAPCSPVYEYDYDDMNYHLQGLGESKVEKAGVLDQIIAIMKWETRRDLEWRGVQRMVGKVKGAVERAWDSIGEKKGGVERVVRRRIEGLTT